MNPLTPGLQTADLLLKLNTGFIWKSVSTHTHPHMDAHWLKRTHAHKFKQESLGEICDLVKTHWGTNGSDELHLSNSTCSMSLSCSAGRRDRRGERERVVVNIRQALWSKVGGGYYMQLLGWAYACQNICKGGLYFLNGSCRKPLFFSLWKSFLF